MSRRHTCRRACGRPALAALVFLTVFATCAPTVVAARGGKLRVGVVEVEDRYTGVAGLRRAVRKLGHRAKPFRKATELRKLDALVVGSFLTSSHRGLNPLAHNRAEVTRWVRDGHTLIVLAQEWVDAVQARPWLPEGAGLAWGERDGACAWATLPVDQLLGGVAMDGTGRFGCWRVAPSGGDKSALVSGVHDGFSEWPGYRVVAWADREQRVPAIVVRSLGKGRVVAVAMALDKYAERPADKAQGRAARALLGATLDYAAAVARGDAPAEPSGDRPKGAERAPRGTVTVRVFDDRDGDGRRGEGEPGLAGVRVGHGVVRLITDAAGEVKLDVDAAFPRWIHVQTPSAWSAPGGMFSRDDQGQVALFPLRAREKPEERFSVVHITDLHVGARAYSGELLAELVARAGEVTDPPPAFILATGDLTQRGTEDEIAGYEAATANAGLPILNVMGNHDAGRGPDRGRYYLERLGPMFYGFDRGGLHFTVGYVTPAGSAGRDWLLRDATESGLPTVLVLHHLPRASVLEELAKAPLVAIVHGHWHGNRVADVGGVPVVATSTALFAGWDHSPASYRVLTFDRGVLVGSERRYTAARENVYLAAPADGDPFPEQVVVHALDAFRPPTGGQVALSGPGGERQLTLAQVGALTWTAPLPEGLPAGSYRFEVTMQRPGGVFAPIAQTVELGTARGEPSEPGGRWPAYRGGDRRRGDRTARRGGGPRPPLALAWVRPLGGEVHHASPVADAERLYVALEDRSRLPTDPNRASRVVALSRRDGQVVWSHPTDTSVRQSPALSRGRVYVQEESGDVTALSAEDGRVVWRFRMAGEESPRYLAHWASAAPLTLDGRVWTGYHRRPVVLSGRDGTRVGRLRRQGREDAFTLASMAAGGGVVVHGGLSSGVAAYDAARPGSAKPLWRVKQGGLYATPVVHPAGVLVQTTKGLRLYEPKTGEELLALKVRGARSPAPPILVDDTIVTVERDGRLAAWSRGTGKRRWRVGGDPALLPQSVSAAPGTRSISSAPALGRGRVWVGTDDGQLMAVRLRDGAVVWRRSLGLPVTGGPVPLGKAVYAADLGGTIWAFEEIRRR